MLPDDLGDRVRIARRRWPWRSPGAGGASRAASPPTAAPAGGRGRGATSRPGPVATSRRGRRARTPSDGVPRPRRRTRRSRRRGSPAPGARGSARSPSRPPRSSSRLDGDGGLERLADELGLADRREIDAADERTGLRVDVDEPLVGEADQRLADRRPADPEARCHLGLGDRLAGQDGDADDRVAERVVDLRHDRQAAVDRRARCDCHGRAEAPGSRRRDASGPVDPHASGRGTGDGLDQPLQVADGVRTAAVAVRRVVEHPRHVIVDQETVERPSDGGAGRPRPDRSCPPR